MADEERSAAAIDPAANAAIAAKASHTRGLVGMFMARAPVSRDYSGTPMLAIALALALSTSASDGPSLRQVLDRTATYIANFARDLSGIVAEEHYRQTVHFPRPYRVTENLERHTRSDLLLVKPAGARDWLQFRDVYEVDDRPVRDRDNRLVRLFLDPPESTSAQVAAILDESARYNIGSLLRTVNTPLLPLTFLEAKNQGRFRFKRTTNAQPAEMTIESPAPPGRFRLTTEVWAVEYSERMANTIVRTNGLRDLPSRGRFWIEPDTGRVLMSELILENRQVRGVITVNYQSEPLLGLLVPIEMRERYDKLRDRSIIDGYASYGRFRQFQVKVDEKLGPIKK
jgi:hypothetical protein